MHVGQVSHPQRALRVGGLGAKGLDTHHRDSAHPKRPGQDVATRREIDAID
jgi:hypothetical protein